MLKLCRQALNLPITGSKRQLLNRLKRECREKWPRRPQRNQSEFPRLKLKGRPATRTTTVTGCSSESLPANLDNVNNEDNALSDRASLSSMYEMIESDPEPDESSFQQNTGFSQSQCAAIEAIVTDSVRSAITTLQTSPAAHLPSASTQNLFSPGMASPLGLSRPVDKTLRTKYSGVRLTLRYFCPTHYTSPIPLKCSSVWTTRPQAHGFSGYHGQKEKTVIDKFSTLTRPTC